MVEDHEDVEDEDKHYEDICCDELFSSIDNKNDECGQRKDAGDDAEEKDGVERQAVASR